MIIVHHMYNIKFTITHQLTKLNLFYETESRLSHEKNTATRPYLAS